MSARDGGGVGSWRKLGSAGPVQALAVGAVGGVNRIVSGGWDATVRIWDPDSGEELRTLRGHSDRVNAVVVVGGADRIVSAGWDGTVRIWDADSGEELRTLRGHDGIVKAMAVGTIG